MFANAGFDGREAPLGIDFFFFLVGSLMISVIAVIPAWERPTRCQLSLSLIACVVRVRGGCCLALLLCPPVSLLDDRHFLHQSAHGHVQDDLRMRTIVHFSASHEAMLRVV